MNNKNALTLRLLVAGHTACFRRPEFTDDFVSYDVMPPSVAVRLLGLIYLPEGGVWSLRSIDVLNPIKFEMEEIVSGRGPRRALVLKDVRYLLTGVLTTSSGEEVDHAHRLAELLSSHRRAHLGLENYPATLQVADDELPASKCFVPMTVDLGWMLYRPRAEGEKSPIFFRAQLCAGRLDLTAKVLTVR